jgi:beta-fructofuranosidase
MRVGGIQNGPGYREPNAYISALHRRPDVGVLGDTIPFYWHGVYHIFYLHPVAGGVDWNHVSTKDFISWKEYPTALRPDGPANGPDGMCMFTGSVVEKDGLFHCYYTGHNPSNPDGLEFIMHATSSDLVAWTKHPEDILRPDGLIYRIGKKSNPNAPWNPADWDFRDPYVFFNQDEGRYWMVFLADDAGTGKQVQGLAVSKDLVKWEFQPSLDVPFAQECPDVFKIGSTWYLIGGSAYLIAANPRGPYRTIGDSVIDPPFIYAGKRMFDGRRHVWTGWLRDREGNTDSGNLLWGGTQCLPRELYQADDLSLGCKPVGEALSAFGNHIINLAEKSDHELNLPSWTESADALANPEAMDRRLYSTHRLIICWNVHWI